jgi:hypothetical protein
LRADKPKRSDDQFDFHRLLIRRFFQGLDVLDVTYDEYVTTLAGLGDVQRWERGESPKDATATTTGDGGAKPMSPDEWIAWAKANPAEAARQAAAGPLKLDPAAKRKMYDDLFTTDGKRLLGVEVQTEGA